MELVKMTDTLWSRTNGNPLVVSDDARLAAKELALTNKDWMMDFQAVQNVRCTACGSLRNPLYPICPTCKSVDQTHPSAKDLKFAV
jgi:lipopolysaccharide biosynthesis regulator YciM